MTDTEKRESMKLPAGKTCNDCSNFGFCEGIGCSWSGRTECDYYPNRFTPKVTAPPKGGVTTHVEIIIASPPDHSYAFSTICVDGHDYASGISKTPQAALEKACAYLTQKCRRCGCTLLNPCDEPGCSWVKADLCSSCQPKQKRRRK